MTQVGNPEGEDKPNKKVCSRRLRVANLKLTRIIVLRPPCLGPRGRKYAYRSRKGSLYRLGQRWCVIFIDLSSLPAHLTIGSQTDFKENGVSRHQH